MNIMKCRKCKNELFNIQIIPCCGECSENGAWSEGDDEYIYDEKKINDLDLIRNEVEENGECNYGTAAGVGCYMFRCSNCGAKTNLHVIDGC